MKNKLFLTLLLFLSIVLFACHRIKKKSEEMADRTEEKIKEKTADLSNKVIPRFDDHEPDTKYNRQRFTEFIQVELSSDIKNIYCYADIMGIDQTYQFGFNCLPATADLIIKKHSMVKDTLPDKDHGKGFQKDFPWWNTEKIATLQPYVFTADDERYFQYFWYDAKEQKGYYLDFDL